MSGWVWLKGMDGWKISRYGSACHIRIAALVDRDSITCVEFISSQIAGICDGWRQVDLRDKGVYISGEGWLEGMNGWKIS